MAAVDLTGMTTGLGMEERLMNESIGIITDSIKYLNQIMAIHVLVMSDCTWFDFIRYFETVLLRIRVFVATSYIPRASLLNLPS